MSCSGLAFGGGDCTFSFGGGFGLGMAFGGGRSGGRGISVEDPDGKPGSCILGGGRSGGGQCGRSGSPVRLAICGSCCCSFFGLGGVQGCRVSM